MAVERLRIAQDLHDTVAHRISVISLNAGVASNALNQNPEKAREALGTIRSAFRILQEGLTNAHKHGSQGEARVNISVSPNLLSLSVANPVSETAPERDAESGGGFGLVGLRERAAAIGGTF